MDQAPAKFMGAAERALVKLDTAVYLVKIAACHAAKDSYSDFQMHWKCRDPGSSPGGCPSRSSIGESTYVKLSCF